MKDWKEIEFKARQIADEEIKISDRISLIQMVSGHYKPSIDGNQVDPGEISVEDQSKIREAFGIKEVMTGEDYDNNPLIPDDSPRPAKRQKSGNEYDDNPLIPD